jgi:AbiV family abortive infection protein
MKEIYEAAAKAAYTNCLELLQEANILYAHSKFPRAYALCILSTEELAKSYFYECLSVGVNPTNESSKGLGNHDRKIFRAVNLLLNLYIFSRT